MADKIKGLDPFNLRCSICRAKIDSEKVYAMVDLPGGAQGIVCGDHPGVASHLMPHGTGHLVTGAIIKHSAWAFREELSAEEALEVIRLEQEDLAKKA